MDQNIIYRLQTTHNTCLFHRTIKNGIKEWHILSSILILCQNSLAKPHWKFDSEPRKKLYRNQSQFAFYPNCTDLGPISSSLDFIVPEHKPCCSRLNLKSYIVLLVFFMFSSSALLLNEIARRQKSITTLLLL